MLSQGGLPRLQPEDLHYGSGLSPAGITRQPQMSHPSCPDECLGLGCVCLSSLIHELGM